jgi:hypothetical protein
MAVILATWEIEIRRIVVQGQPGKSSQRPHLKGKKLGVVDTCHPSYSGNLNRKIMVPTGSQHKVQHYLKNKGWRGDKRERWRG